MHLAKIPERKRTPKMAYSIACRNCCFMS